MDYFNDAETMDLFAALEAADMEDEDEQPEDLVAEPELPV